MSIPIVFKGVNDENGDRLSDGGLFHTLPIEQIEDYVSDCIKNNLSKAEIHLISASPFEFNPPKIVENGFARPIKETVRLTKSLHNITIHNDIRYLNLFVENCNLKGFHLKIHNHVFPAKLMEKLTRRFHSSVIIRLQKTRCSNCLRLAKKLLKIEIMIKIFILKSGCYINTF